MDKEDEIWFKIQLLCKGLKSNELSQQLFAEQNPYNHKRTGNAGLQLLLGEICTPANVPTGDRFTDYSPYTLGLVDDDYYIFERGEAACRCLPVPTPSWYTRTLSDGVPAGRVLLQEGTSTLISAIRNACEYCSSGEACAFCSIGKYASKKYGILIKKPHQIAEAVIFAVRASKDRKLTLDLTGGNTLTPDRGASMYVDVVKAIRAVNDIPICVEISPPETDEYLSELADAGVNAFMMNLEIWDEKLRHLFMPGKSRISKGRYFEAWRHALSIVGTNRVSSVLIAGLESTRSTLDGARHLIDSGVIPTIMPFRPNDGSILENFDTPDPDNVGHITFEVGRLLAENSLNPKLHPGCISCSACSAEADCRLLF